jgi:tRNA pseudouridine13 synthase
MPAATIRSQPEDFAVDEVLGFLPSGSGEHDLLHIEKTGANTNWLATQLAAFAGVPVRDVGFSGMKDRNAVTRQWFSVHRPANAAADWNACHIEGVRFIESQQHNRKLRRGAHTGNRFRIVLRGNGTLGAQQRERLQLVGQAGVPNYFGEQRFGRGGNNLGLAEALFGGKRLSRQKRGIALSSARAFIFNHTLQRRVMDGRWDQLLPGDRASLQGSNSTFSVDQTDQQLKQRCEEQDIHPSGPLWGRGEPGTAGDVSALEQSVADSFPLLRDGLEKHAAAARRALRLQVSDLNWYELDDALRVEFFLARGGFATAVLREISDYRVQIQSPTRGAS